MADEEKNETQGAEPQAEAPAESAAPASETAPEQTAEGDQSQADSSADQQGGQDQGGDPRQQRRGRGGRRQERSRPVEGEIEEVVVKVYRCSTVVKGGRRFSFGALVIAGDRRGKVGVGYGKANEVPNAVEKATKERRRNMIAIELEGTTIPHQVIGKFSASKVMLHPAGAGTGVIAGDSVRTVMDLAGVKDVLTKVYGSTSPKNLVKAAHQALVNLRSRDQVAQLRGVAV